MRHESRLGDARFDRGEVTPSSSNRRRVRDSLRENDRLRQDSYGSKRPFTSFVSWKAPEDDTDEAQKVADDMRGTPSRIRTDPS